MDQATACTEASWIYLGAELGWVREGGKVSRIWDKAE